MNDDSKQTGIRMAIKVTAITIGATAVVMAASASAFAAPDAEGAPASEVTDADAQPEAAPPLKLDGWSCMSRGPLAPPVAPADFDGLLARVPA